MPQSLLMARFILTLEGWAWAQSRATMQGPLGLPRAFVAVAVRAAESDLEVNGFTKAELREVVSEDTANNFLFNEAWDFLVRGEFIKFMGRHWERDRRQQGQ